MFGLNIASIVIVACAVAPTVRASNNIVVVLFAMFLVLRNCCAILLYVAHPA